MRTRPSQSTKVPAFSACAATGSTTSATAVTAEGRISSDTTNGRAKAVGGTGDAEVGGVDATDDERAELAGRRCRDDAGRVAARGVVEGLHTPGGGDLGACRGIRERAATGQQGGQRTGLERTALTGPAGHPGEAGAGGLGEGGRGAQRTGDRREALADEHHGVVAQALARGGDDVGAGTLTEGAQHLGLGDRARSG